MPKLRHYDNLNTARFVTFSCYHSRKYFDKPEIYNLFIEHLKLLRNKHGFKLYGYVIMPDHVHMVLYPQPDTKMGYLIRELKSKMAREYFSKYCKNNSDNNVFWQKRCYDHNCRTPEIVVEKINYCHNNPVRAGLTSEPSEWEWSSYNWYTGKNDVPIVMDKLDV
jgi:putative transposase